MCAADDAILQQKTTHMYISQTTDVDNTMHNAADHIISV